MKEMVRVRWPCTRVRVFLLSQWIKELTIRLSMVETPDGAKDNN